MRRYLHITAVSFWNGQIVVVEDGAELADAIAARLRSDGHAVAVAEDGPSASR
jgi:DNA-binding response OmpR family regulator